MILTIENHEHTQYWTLDHPSDGNSLGLKMYSELHRALEALESESHPWFKSQESGHLRIRSLVIQAKTSEVEQCPVWIAGGNLKELSKLQTKASGRDYLYKMRELCRRLSGLPIPVIFSIHGKVIGGGAELILFGDFRLATTVSKFYFKQLFVGLSCSYGSSERLRLLTGQGRAWSLLCNPEPVLANQALNWGLLQSTHSDRSQLNQAVKALISQLNTIDPLVFATQKALFNASMEQPEEQGTKELDLIEALWMNPAHKKYLEGFMSPKAATQKPID